MRASRTLFLTLAALSSNGSLQAAPPAGLEATFRFGSATVLPGAEVRVPIFVSSNEPLGGLSISVDFDEEVLEATSVELVYQRPDGKGWYSRLIFTDVHVNGRSNINNANETPGNGGVDEGYLYAAAVFAPEEGWEVFSQGGGRLEDLLPPVNVENEILAVHFRVRPEAPSGETHIRFIDNAPSVNPAVPVQNVASLLPGYSAALQTELGVLGVTGVLAIAGGPRGFIRGDSNGSARVDLSDAVATLNHLFSGTQILHCLDAADANDDGHLDISDPIAVLASLFLAAGPLPPPNESPGEDPTEDSLACLR